MFDSPGGGTASGLIGTAALRRRKAEEKRSLNFSESCGVKGEASELPEKFCDSHWRKVAPETVKSMAVWAMPTVGAGLPTGTWIGFVMPVVVVAIIKLIDAAPPRTLFNWEALT